MGAARRILGVLYGMEWAVVARRVLLGLAAGEALSLPQLLGVEPPEAPSGVYGIDVGGGLAYGSVTESAVLLALSLDEGCGFNPSLYASMLAERADLENPLRHYASSTVEALMHVRRGVPWGRARQLVTSTEPPLEAVARAAPLPLFYRSRRLAAEMAAAQALTTSLDLEVARAARLYASALHYTLTGLPPEEALAEAALEEPLGPIRSAVLTALEEAEHGREPPAQGHTPGPMDGYMVASTVAAAAYAASASRTVREAAWLASRWPGAEPRTAAAVASSLLAASGRAADLEELAARLEARELVEKAARALEAARARCIFEE